MNAEDIQNAQVRLYVKRRADGQISFFCCLDNGPRKTHWTTSSLSHLNADTQKQISGFLTLLLAEAVNLLQSNSGLVAPFSLISSSDTNQSMYSPSETFPLDTLPTTEN